jgi:hypothetical protein
MGLSHNISRGISSSILKSTSKVDVAPQRQNTDFGRFRYNFHMFMGCGNRRIELGCGYGSLTATTSAHCGKSYEAATYSCISGCLCGLGNCLDLLLGTRRPLLKGERFYQQKGAILVSLHR